MILGGTNEQYDFINITMEYFQYQVACSRRVPENLWKLEITLKVEIMIVFNERFIV